MPADSFEEGAEGALAAQTLGQEVEVALRAALVEVAPGLVAAARGEEVGVRRTILEAEERRDQRGLAVRLRVRDIVERRTASGIRGEDASRVELEQREESAADFQYFAQARVLGVKL